MDFISIDLETTGTLPYVDRIVEIAAVHFQNGSIVDEFQTLINPGIPIPSEATKINTITNEMVQSKPRIEAVLDKFSSFCKDNILVAHNASFDFQFLCSSIKKYNSSAPSGPILDTYILSKKTMSGMSNYKLSTLSKHLKIKNDLFHRAREDAACCGYLFQHIVNQLKISHWRQLIQIAGKSALRFPQLKYTHQQLQLL